MRFLFLLLTLILQLNVSGYNLHNPQENHEIKTLTAENEDFNERSCILFRYYSPDEGMYISQDPIGLQGGFELYGYVYDPNFWIDIFGLRGNDSYPSWMPKKTNYERHHIIPYEHRNHEVFKLTGMDINNATNMIYLPRKESTHPTKAVHSYFNLNGRPHNEYNATMRGHLNRLRDQAWDKTNKKWKPGWNAERLRKSLLELQHKKRKELNNARGSKGCKK